MPARATARPPAYPPAYLAAVRAYMAAGWTPLQAHQAATQAGLH
jgi:hypothetical protein